MLQAIDLRVAFADLDKVSTLLSHRARIAPSLCSAVVMIQRAASGQNQRVIIVGQFRTWTVIDSLEFGFTDHRTVQMQSRCAGMFRVRAGPLKSGHVFLQAIV